MKQDDFDGLMDRLADLVGGPAFEDQDDFRRHLEVDDGDPPPWQSGALAFDQLDIDQLGTLVLHLAMANRAVLAEMDRRPEGRGRLAHNPARWMM